jgi:hypothetical protein
MLFQDCTERFPQAEDVWLSWTKFEESVLDLEEAGKVYLYLLFWLLVADFCTQTEHFLTLKKKQKKKNRHWRARRALTGERLTRFLELATTH